MLLVLAPRKCEGEGRQAGKRWAMRKKWPGPPCLSLALYKGKSEPRASPSFHIWALGGAPAPSWALPQRSSPQHSLTATGRNCSFPKCPWFPGGKLESSCISPNGMGSAMGSAHVQVPDGSGVLMAFLWLVLFREFMTTGRTPVGLGWFKGDCPDLEFPYANPSGYQDFYF